MRFVKAIFGGSKKASFTLVGVLAGLLTQIGLPQEVADLIIKVIMAYLGAQGLNDAAASFRKV